MDIIERYLSSLKILLPANQRDDIVAELRDVLLSRRRDRSGEIGRALTLEEDEQLLRDFGHPVIVAARYRKPAYLIGPDLFPLYAFVLKLAIAALLVVTLVIGVVTVIAMDAAPWRIFYKTLAVTWNGALNCIAVVTMIFAAVERLPPSSRLLNDWRARNLPRITPRRRSTWFDHTAGIAANVLFILWWTHAIHLSPVIPLDADKSLQLSFTPVWQFLYWPVLGLSVLAIAINALRMP